MIDLCVINYNTKDKLERFIETLLSDDMNPSPWRLFVADNGSTDGSRKYLQDLYWDKRLNHHEVDVIYGSNVGYAVAANQLVERGCSPYIAILNADVWMTTTDVLAMMDIMETTGFEIMGPKQRDEGGRIRHGGIDGTNERPRLRGWGNYDPDDELFLDTAQMVSVSGSAYFMRRDAWDALTECAVYKKIAPSATGAFLPTQMYYEETWCSYHAREHGMRVVYTGLVSIGHTWAASSGGDNRGLIDVKRESQEFFRMACKIHGISCD